MASNRRYPSKNCKNPECNKPFIPHDKRQVYCTRQCQIDAGNDKKNRTYDEVKYQRKLEESDLILDYLYTHAGGAQYSIKESMLRLQKVDLTIGTLAINKRTGKEIRWYIHFGLECISRKENNYFIVRRVKNNL